MLTSYCIIQNFKTKEYLGSHRGFPTWYLDYREADRYYQNRYEIEFGENELEELEDIQFEIIEIFEILKD